MLGIIVRTSLVATLYFYGLWKQGFCIALYVTCGARSAWLSMSQNSLRLFVCGCLHSTTMLTSDAHSLTTLRETLCSVFAGVHI